MGDKNAKKNTSQFDPIYLMKLVKENMNDESIMTHKEKNSFKSIKLHNIQVTKDILINSMFLEIFVRKGNSKH